MLRIPLKSGLLLGLALLTQSALVACQGSVSLEPVSLEPVSLEPVSLEPVSPLKDTRPATARPATARPATARPATARPATARPATARPGSARPGPLRLGVWIPHWHRARGARRVMRHIGLFDSVSAFGFLVKPGGRIDDTLRHRRGDWRRLHAAARHRGVEVLPTLAWARARDIHWVISRPTARRRHVAAIVALAVKHRFRGVDIDYEGKLQATRKYFSQFLEDLSVALHQQGKVLSCTLEARTTDKPPKARRAAALFPWSNDLATLGRVCDRVRVMAYDQWFAERGATTWTGKTRRPHVPNADLGWMRRVIAHFLRYVPRQKLELGVPTYGWLFAVEGKPGAWTYKRISALSHTRLLRLVKRFGAKTRRTPGGELSLAYKRKGERRTGTLCDARCVRERIALARRLGLRGVVLFKIEGEEDPGLWRVLGPGQKTRAFQQSK